MSPHSYLFAVALVVAGLTACGGREAQESTPAPAQSAGQVAPVVVTQVGQYAAARFAEQVSFGPTPALVAEIRSKGYSRWLDDQFALPASSIDLTPFLGFPDPPPQADDARYRSLFLNLAVGAADQLRLRVTWSLSQFVVVSDRKVDAVGTMAWINLLQQQGLGSYADLLYNTSISPAMGVYLDNNQNRPKSAACPNCAPNENFARELMQLFTVGVFKLNADGTPVRDANGNFIETYTQTDVEQLARVLTGWSHDPNPAIRPQRNWANWLKPMVASTQPFERDSGQKTVLGKVFPAGQSTAKDLRDAIDLVMAHPNIAPFVATRMIQHLVKSNPSPAYVGRVVARFRNNGSGVAGDMKAVVKAVLLDAEARAGDDPTASRSDDGKLREPFLHYMSIWRGLGCNKVPVPGGQPAPYPYQRGDQTPFNATSVFSFYAPTDRAPGSNLLAPEQKLVNASEFTSRLNGVNGTRWDGSANTRAALEGAGCDFDAFSRAYGTSTAAFNDLVSARFFRGAMSPKLRNTIEQLVKQPQWDVRSLDEGPARMLDFALTSPYYGVMK